MIKLERVKNQKSKLSQFMMINKKIKILFRQLKILIKLLNSLHKTLLNFKTQILLCTIDQGNRKE